MSSLSFAKGQRWISNTESELGLGVVLEHDSRRVTLSFPAADETRTYADNNAPLTRVQYRAGEQVQYQSGNSLTVTDVMENNGCLIYAGVDPSGEQIIVPETELDSDVLFGGPLERLLAGQLDSGRRFQLRRQTLTQLARLQQSSVRGLLGARVELLPHQIYIAAEVAGRHAPRVLLADEVGLGKTIEAGLILHQQLICGRARRVLVVVPESLLHQWLVEMLRRFNLQFSILDSARCEDLQNAGTDNPFDSAQLVLCSLSFLLGDAEPLQQALRADWDLLVVDEAHHLAWSAQQPSRAYSGIEALARRARGLLLLTATPEQLGIESHFARLRLLDPDRYHDFEQFCAEEAKYQPVNELVQRLLGTDAAALFAGSAALRAQLQHYLGGDAAGRVLQTLSAGDETAVAEAVAGAAQALLDRHGTGRVLFRNTRAASSGFPERRLQPHPLDPPAACVQATAPGPAARLHPEQVLGPDWPRRDTRVTWLVQWLKAIRPAKALLICAQSETALDLEEYLRLRVGIRSAVFHQHLSLIERDRAAAYFADDIDGAQILVCSEIGSEGRNFQFAHHLVLFDLPRNPDLLEQRIGRLDRIGQTETVQIHVPYYRDTAQQHLLQWYREGIDAFDRACPAGAAIAARFAERLERCLGGDIAGLAPLIEDTRAFTEATLADLEAGRDRLLELNSCNPQRAAATIAQLLETEAVEALQQYMEGVLDEFGVEQDYHSEGAVILHPGDHMPVQRFPGLPDEGVTATYQRRIALSREDMLFLSWEHPMVSGAMDLIVNADFGSTSFCTVKLGPLKPGTLLVEAVFALHSTAPRTLQLSRYLPAELTTILLDSNDNDLSEVISGRQLDQLAQAVPRKTARNLINHARSEISRLSRRAQDLAAAQQTRIIAAAVDDMQRQQRRELERLQALAQVNPNIRREEIDHIEATTRDLEAHLNSARIKLEALRVAVAT